MILTGKCEYSLGYVVILRNVWLHAIKTHRFIKRILIYYNTNVTVKSPSWKSCPCHPLRSTYQFISLQIPNHQLAVSYHTTAIS